MRPEIARNVLIGLAALVVIATLALTGFVGRNWISSWGDKSGIPTVMVVSQETLQAGAEANLSIAEQKDKAASAIKDSTDARAKAGSGAQTTTDNKGGTAASSGLSSDAERSQALSLTLVTRALEDELGGAVAQALGESGRFQPLPMNAVSTALAEARRKNQLPEPKSSGPVTSVTSVRNVTPKSGEGNVEGGSTSTGPALPGLKDVASSLKADYTLVVSIGEPRLVYDVIAPRSDAPYRFVLSAQPVISAELFSTRGTQAYRLQKQFERRISSTIPLASQLPNLGNIRIALDKVNAEISQVAAQEILAWALDKVAPARVLEVGDKIVINRGSNDGVTVGAVYDVERETGDVFTEGGDENGDGGTALEKLRKPVGSIVIQSVQGRIATATKASGGPFLRDDLVKMVKTAPSGGAATASNAGAGAIPLGSRAMAEADSARNSGVAQRQANVAVNFVTVNGRDNGGQYGQMVADALAKDPRITILPRAALDQILTERSLNAVATSDYENLGVQGMRASAYLISGEFRSSTSRHAKTITVGGISQTVSTSSSTAVSGTLRATSVDGKLVETIQVSGAPSVEAAILTGGRQMLLKLFPMRIVQVAGDTIYVNRGQDGGVRIGSRLRLYHLGAPIVDKQTGALLSQGARMLSGEAVVTDVQENVSVARLSGGASAVIDDLAELAGMAAPAAPAASKSTATRPASAPAAKPKKTGTPTPARPREEKGLHF